MNGDYKILNYTRFFSTLRTLKHKVMPKVLLVLIIAALELYMTLCKYLLKQYVSSNIMFD